MPSPGTYQTPLTPTDIEVLKLHVATLQSYLDLCKGSAASALTRAEQVINAPNAPPQLVFSAVLYRAEALVRLGEQVEGRGGKGREDAGADSLPALTTVPHPYPQPLSPQLSKAA